MLIKYSNYFLFKMIPIKFNADLNIMYDQSQVFFSID